MTRSRSCSATGLQTFQSGLHIGIQAFRPWLTLTLRLGQVLLQIMGQVTQLFLSGQAGTAFEVVQHPQQFGG